MTGIRNIIKQFPPLRSLLQTTAYRRFRHQIALRTDSRMTYKTFTRFLRLPGQFDALAGPVIEALKVSEAKEPLRIIVLGCSTGAEVWSIVTTLISKRPGLPFRVDGYDISDEVLAQARKGVYTANELLTHDAITPEFVQKTFEQEGDRYRVRDSLREHVTFARLDVFTPGIHDLIGSGDIVFAQNFLYNFNPADSRRAFMNICTLLKPRSALFVEGMDLGQRTRLTRRCGLEPLDYRIKEIHDDARIVRADGWPYNYWGLEPLSTSRRNWKRYYNTVFTKGLKPEEMPTDQ